MEPVVSWISGNILFIGLAVCLILLLVIYFELYRRRKLKRSL
jgi:hypothetical protein